MTDRVVVYRNLNRSRPRRPVWSVADATSTDGKGRVREHRETVHLTNVRPIVSKRAETIRTNGGHREVVAWLAGELADPISPPDTEHRVSFDLYADARFRADGETFDHADRARFGPDGAYVEGPR